MGLFGNLFGTASKSVALIDIGSGSVGGGYLSYGKDGRTLEFSARVPVRAHEGEMLTLAMLRALAELDEKLIKEGAPALRRATGSGHVAEVLVSIASPWQETVVRVERVEEAKPFTFTRQLLKQVVERTTDVREGRMGSGEAAIATMLNGYETNEPFGKSVKLADIVVLSSSLEKTAAESVETALRKTYHTHRITFAAFAACAYAVFRDVYPHEKNYLVIDVSGEATDLVFVKHGLLASMITVPFGTNHLTRPSGTVSLSPDIKEKEEKKEGEGIHVYKDTNQKTTNTAKSQWIAAVLDALKIFSEEHALPRTIFLISDENVRDYMSRALDDSTIRSLWLSDEPLSILPVLPSHFSNFVKTGAAGTADTPLLMLALYHGKRVDDLHA